VGESHCESALAMMIVLLKIWLTLPFGARMWTVIICAKLANLKLKRPWRVEIKESCWPEWNSYWGM